MTSCGCGCNPETSGSRGGEDKGWGCAESSRLKNKAVLRLVSSHTKGSLTTHKHLDPCTGTSGMCGLHSAYLEDGQEATNPSLFVCKLGLGSHLKILVAFRLGPRVW